MSKKHKRIGGKLTSWQFHTIYEDVEKANEYLKINGRELIQTDKAYKMTATVIEDYLGRWQPGNHMTSSLVISYDEETGIVETENTIYQLEGEPGDMFPDLGVNVNKIFY